MNKTIAQQLNIKEFPFNIFNSVGKLIYREYSNGYWCKWRCDSNGNETHFEDSEGYWENREFDSEGNEIYYEDSSGYIEDNRNTPEYIMEELVEKIGIMKTIYLTDQNGDKIAFKCEDISELKGELENRKIDIGHDVIIGNDVSIGYGSKIGQYVKIGDHVTIGHDVSIRPHAILEDYAKIGDGVRLKRRLYERRI